MIFAGVALILMLAPGSGSETGLGTPSKRITRPSSPTATNKQNAINSEEASAPNMVLDTQNQFNHDTIQALMMTR
jgi:hypothetical protein